jgi:hypothetical protein
MSTQTTALIVTSISSPNPVLKELASASKDRGVNFIVIGDVKSPPTFELDGCRFFGMSEQEKLPFSFVTLCPTKHYARKNIGYLVALSEGAEVLTETDDDNFPREAFWDARVRVQNVGLIQDAGWVNVYRYFSDANIWPRGLPLSHIHISVPPRDALAMTSADCPIQQGLADENPDVDAVYRLVLPLPQNFRQDAPVSLGRGSWSPFNSQNTTWWREAAPLMYLPSYCTFRMTDIWRSFVAQRIAWENNWSVLYHSATLWQERNEHNLMRDFKDEIPGYVNNDEIQVAFDALTLKPGIQNIPDNMRQCYQKLVDMQLIDPKEIAST